MLQGASGTTVPAHVVELGQGRPVVFLHGLVGLNEHWEEVAERVRHRLRCIMLELPLLDLRGPDCSIDGVVALTTQFLKSGYARLGPHGPGEPAVGGDGGVAPTVLVGNSFGGHVALRIAIEHPELVGALVLAGSSGLIERSMVREVELRPSREWLERKIAELFCDPGRHLRQADVDRAYEQLSQRPKARAMVRLSRSARRDYLGERIREVQAPALLIWGLEDVVTPPEAAEAFLARLPRARIVWFERCGHAPMLEQPEGFARAVLEFAAELEAADRARSGQRVEE